MADPKVQLRQELKSAREALDKKEWKEALQHCKAALKLDGKNYNVFVFIGLAAAELGQEKQSEEAYRRATALQPSTILAWQVIVRLYRECPPGGGL
jgi:superkiller protein 3